MVFTTYARKMRKGRFPPFGFVSSEFWLGAPVLQRSLAVFDSGNRIMEFLSMCQKDAQESVSPFGFVSSEFGLCARALQRVLVVFESVARIMIFSAFATKMRKGRFLPFGFVSSEFRLQLIFCIRISFCRARALIYFLHTLRNKKICSFWLCRSGLVFSCAWGEFLVWWLPYVLEFWPCASIDTFVAHPPTYAPTHLPTHTAGALHEHVWGILWALRCITRALGVRGFAIICKFLGRETLVEFLGGVGGHLPPGGVGWSGSGSS